MANAQSKPSVTIIIPAHNEETVIENKLINLINLNYPAELVEIIIASDNSTDKTNEIVTSFIENNRNHIIKLYKVQQRKGKTNAQNEAVKIAKGEILVFSDANAMLDSEAVNYLVSSFISKDIVYVTGRLQYVNNLEFASSNTENNYWQYDLFMRQIESDIQTITAGNGAIYAIRRIDYVDFNPIACHDSAMPIFAGINQKRAIYNSNAVAYEKAGETSGDEFKRKVRMNREILTFIFGNIKKYNVFKNGWFSYFYLGHRTLRYSLFLFHLSALITNLILSIENKFYLITFVLQILFYFLAGCKLIFGFNHKIFYYPYYYTMTIAAQLVGAMRQISGRSKPFWDKAETTR